MLKGFNFLSQLRQAKGLGEEHMARVLGVSVDRLQLIERAAVAPPPETFILYANELGVTVEELLACHLNMYAAQFCAKLGLGRRIQFYFEEDPCGTSLGAEARLKFDRKRGNSSPPWGTRTITESAQNLPQQEWPPLGQNS